MDAPKEFSNEAITAERMKLIKSLKPDPEKIIFGQYEGYKTEENVDPNSNTDTFFALKTEIQNERYSGVPIYMRAGKKLERSVAEVAIVFKVPETRISKDKTYHTEPNVLFYRIQPNEGIILKILVKKPGPQILVEPTYMQFCYRQLSGGLSDPYEKLLLDAINGDQTFFNDAPEVEAQWEFIDPLIDSKEESHVYQSGSWGPKEANKIIEADGRSWLEPSVEFCQL
jgi:glucose-6-phosphate 1-dehydrogenase